MEQSFWRSRWQEHKIGFHVDQVNPTLLQYWEQAVGPRARGRVLVPLCGKSLDLVWLAEQGLDVVGVEFVAQAVDEFFAEQSLPKEVTTHAGQQRSSGQLPAGGAIEIWNSDFFKLTPEQVGPVDFIYDRAAMVAIQPERRAEYVKQLHRLSKPAAKMLTLTFIHDIGSGPPFSIDNSELLAHSSNLFSLEQLGERDILEHEPRFRDRGATFMNEIVWRGQSLE